jgi:serine/threonine protein phosphatase PrpC
MLKFAKFVERGGQELQDRVEITERSGAVVIVVADGSGGRSGGAEAADIVLKTVRAAANSLAVADAVACVRLLVEMDRAIDRDQAAGETTAVIAIVREKEKEIVGASAGDSEAWVMSTAGYERLTHGQVRKPLLGSGVAVPVSFQHIFSEGTLLAATDGLFKYTGAERICAAVAGEDLNQAALSLANLVRLRSGALPDDVGIVLARMERA